MIVWVIIARIIKIWMKNCSLMIGLSRNKFIVEHKNLLGIERKLKYLWWFFHAAFFCNYKPSTPIMNLEPLF